MIAAAPLFALIVTITVTMTMIMAVTITMLTPPRAIVFIVPVMLMATVVIAMILLPIIVILIMGQIVWCLGLTPISRVLTLFLPLHPTTPRMIVHLKHLEAQIPMQLLPPSSAAGKCFGGRQVGTHECLCFFQTQVLSHQFHQILWILTAFLPG